ncbi:hypothetical protein CRENBAI_000492 [Crenichthys baileyi]|uniref:Uncharacterized protein n=1 Tax=Crenichthys baileyi TaxID=28760 RepID=A0AAV9S2E0_9TELE
MNISDNVFVKENQTKQVYGTVEKNNTSSSEYKKLCNFFIKKTFKLSQGSWRNRKRKGESTLCAAVASYPHLCSHLTGYVASPQLTQLSRCISSKIHSPFIASADAFLRVHSKLGDGDLPPPPISRKLSQRRKEEADPGRNRSIQQRESGLWQERC